MLPSYVTDGRIDDQIEQANLLCRDLGYLPLALELVARLLRRRTNWTVAKIREKLAENGLADQSLIKNPKFDSAMTAERGVKAAFDLSWQELENEPNAQKLAMYLSLFALASFPKSLIDGLFPKTDEDEIEEWLTDSLVHLNLVKPLGDGWYELHTLIRHYLRDKLEESEVKETAKKAYSTMMVFIAKQIDQTLTLEDISQIEPLVDHLKITVEELNKWLEDEDLFWPFYGLGNFYRAQGLYSEAIFYCEKCLILSEQQLDMEHLTIAVTLNNLGFLYEAQGKYAEAEPFYLRSLAIREKQLGENHPAFATSLNNLALLYKFQGKYEEVESFYRRSLAIREKQLGEAHPHVAASLNNLAALYVTQGKYEEAEPLYLRSLTIKENQVEKNHPDIALSLNNLAELYRCKKKYEEAESLYKKALIIQEEKLGDNHPSVATTLNNLAELYRCQEQYKEAEYRYQKALIIQEQKLGDNHPSVATTLNNLAELYRCQEQYKKAESLLFRSLAIRKKQLGDNHPDVGLSLNTLALLYKTQGKYAEAEPLYQRALHIFEQSLGIAHPNTMTVRGNYVQCLKEWVASRQQIFPI
jgi:tetratricopeptide (TPR) repeat protein